MAQPAQLENDTIVALATPVGRSGIGVLRLSGPASLAIATQLVRLRAEPQSRRAHYGIVLDAEGSRLDDGLLTWFAGPASYTGEDVVEIGTHGSPVVLSAVVERARQLGARLARPGEFTERAYLNGRLDLSAAEAVRDVIEAQTLGQARLAAEQVGGALSREIAPQKQALLALIAALEAGIDFAEDDLDTLPAGEIVARIAHVLPAARNLAASFSRGRLLREGIKLAIVGRPNAGKSSLFNRLVGRDRAIVTPVAGTTRDTIAENLVMEDIPVRLLDTAGLRHTVDPVEQMGVARAREAMAEADVIVHVIDAASCLGNEARRDAAASTSGPATTGAEAYATADLALQSRDESVFSDAGRPPVIEVWNKSDLLQTRHSSSAPSSLHGEIYPVPASKLWTSMVTGEGIDELRSAIVRAAQGQDQAVSGAAVLTNLRQHAAMQATVEALQQAHTAAAANMPHEVLLLDLYNALWALDSLTGATLPDDVLQLIFSTFCIGK